MFFLFCIDDVIKVYWRDNELFEDHLDDTYVISGALFLNPISYMPVTLWNTNSTQGTDEVRVNSNIRQTLIKYKVWFTFIRTSGKCG